MNLARRFCGSRVVQHTNFTLRGTLNGRTVRIPVVGGIGLLPDPYWQEESWLNQHLSRLLDSAAGAFVDVGVNLGQTLLKVKTLEPARRYVGFEPNPVCVTYVRRLIAANAFEDCAVAPFGLSDAAAAAVLHARADDPTDSSATMVAGFRKSQDSWGQTPIAVLPGDAALAALRVGPVAVVKIDVEGAELEVVRGLEGTLRAHRPHVVCEVLPTFDRTDARWAVRKPREDELLARMFALGYRMFRLLGDGRAIALDGIEPHRDPALSNYAFVRRETAEAFAAASRVVAPPQAATLT